MKNQVTPRLRLPQSHTEIDFIRVLALPVTFSPATDDFIQLLQDCEIVAATDHNDEILPFCFPEK
jgi:hypothetical protein